MSVTHEFVHVTITKGVSGGMLQIRESAYLDSEGFLQRSRETSDDQILELREGQMPEIDIFTSLQAYRKKIETLQLSSDHPGTEEDYVPEWVYVAIGLADSAIFARESLSFDVPNDVAMLLGLFEDPFGPISRELPLVKTGRDAVYLRAIVLPPKTGSQFRREKLTFRLDGAKIPAESALAHALESPGRLIRVEGESNPFSAFHSRFVARRSTLAVETGGTVVQVRSFLAGGSSSSESPKANE